MFDKTIHFITNIYATAARLQLFVISVRGISRPHLDSMERLIQHIQLRKQIRTVLLKI